MSALPYATAHSLEPPIPESSVPRCPCLGAQPCHCERYARRLEVRQREDAQRLMKASTTLRALAEVAPGDTLKRSLLKLAGDLF